MIIENRNKEVQANQALWDSRVRHKKASGNDY